MTTKSDTFRARLAKLPPASKLTAAALVACALALWTQWLSGDPAYPRFPPGPVVFIAVAAIVVFGARWWWTPLIGGLVSLLVTSGWFARFSADMQRIVHPGSFGRFTAGIFAGSLLLIVGLIVGDVASIVATVQNFRRRQETGDGPKILLRAFGGLLALTGVLIIVGHVPADTYHNLMHLTWGLLAFAASFAGPRVVKYFCIGSGVFYLSLGLLGLALGNAHESFLWHAGPMHLRLGDHIFHLVLSAIFLSAGLVRSRTVTYLQSPA